MRFKRIILDGFVPLSLSGIQQLDWTPEASYQMILGTNGSGKSALMGECSPNPPRPGAYRKGGRKQVTLTHEDIEYVLTSTIGAASTRHSFVRDGVEMNEGGTTAVQKELVKRFFRYDEELHNLLTGRTVFSKMSTAERRKWITRMSRADYTFALKLYDQLRRASTDMQGFLKLTKKRLHDETVALSQMEEVQGIEERVKRLQDELTQLLYARLPSTVSSQEALRQMEAALGQIETTGAMLAKVANQVDLKRKDRTVTELETTVRQHTTAIEVQQSVLDRMQREYGEVEAQLAPLQSIEGADVSQLEARLVELQAQQDALRERSWTFPVLRYADEPDALLSASEEAVPKAMHIFAILPDNSDRRFRREEIERARTLIREATDRIAHDEGAARIIRQKLHAIEHARQETCPECKHVWTPGFSRTEVPELQQKLEAFLREIEQCTARVQEASAYLEEAEQYSSIYRQWRGVVHQYPRLSTLWNHLQEHGLDIVQPATHREVFLTWMEEVRASAELARISADITQTTKVIDVAKLGEGAHLKQRMEGLYHEIHYQTKMLMDHRRWCDLETLQLNLFKRLEQATENWHKAFEQLDVAYMQALEATANEVVERDIVRVQSQLGALQQTLRHKEVLIGVIADLQKSVETAEIDNEALLILTQELSPKEGLIAEQLHGFIKCLTSQINSILSTVWTYELEVLPCGMDDGDLDYKFPLQSGATGPRVDDIAEGSRAQEEMINFAFAQTAMLYLDLKDYPLFVDELGASFDEAHRPAINQFISRLMESQRYSQVFMISHYVAGWGSFNDAEYLVLDSRNITVPSYHNTHAILT
jgi:hypothetical protein